MHYNSYRLMNNVPAGISSHTTIIDINEIDEQLRVDEPAREESLAPVWIGFASAVVIVLGITAMVWVY